MIKIGNRKILLSETLLCPSNEEIEIELNVPNDNDSLIFKIIFIETEKDNDNDKNVTPEMVLNVEDGIGVLRFSNWDQTFGSTLSTPAQVASTDDGDEITILAEIAKLTNLYRINLQFMIEEKNNA